MQAASGPVLLMGQDSPIQHALLRELHSFSVSPRTVRDFGDARVRSSDLGPPPSVLLFATEEIRTGSFEEELAELRVRAASPRLVPIAFGSPPSESQRRALRDAGVDLALFGRFGRHALRFQINRARARSARRRPRGELRTPQEWRTRAFCLGREKALRCYSLSMAGGYFVTPRPWVVGTEISLELPIGQGPLRIGGRVLYTNLTGASANGALPRGMAIQFEPFPDYLRRWIQSGVTESQNKLQV